MHILHPHLVLCFLGWLLPTRKCNDSVNIRCIKLLHSTRRDRSSKARANLAVGQARDSPGGWVLPRMNEVVSEGIRQGCREKGDAMAWSFFSDSGSQTPSFLEAHQLWIPQLLRLGCIVAAPGLYNWCPQLIPHSSLSSAVKSDERP